MPVSNNGNSHKQNMKRQAKTEGLGDKVLSAAKYVSDGISNASNALARANMETERDRTKELRLNALSAWYEKRRKHYDSRIQKDSVFK